MTEWVKSLFKKDQSVPQQTSSNDLFFIHVVYDKKNKLANLYIDYNQILDKYKSPTLSTENTMGLLSDSEQLANCLYSLCNLRDFLPSLILENLNDHKNDSELHNLFISSTLSYIDQVISNKKKPRSKKALIRPSQVFKNGQ